MYNKIKLEITILRNILSLLRLIFQQCGKDEFAVHEYQGQWREE